MDLNRLVEFNTIAKLSSFTKAAEQLGVSTAVLSARFSKFEDQIGKKLFSRNSRTIELTDAGQRFIADSREIIRDYYDAVRVGQSIASDYHLSLNLALSGFGIPPMISSMLSQLNTKHCNLNVAISEDPSWADLLEGRVQLYLGCGDDPGNQRIEQRSFASYRQFVIIPRNHRLSTFAEISLDQLANENILFYPETRLPGIRHWQKKLLDEANIPYTMIGEKIAKSYYYDYVATGICIALLPFFSFPDALPYNLMAIPLAPENSKLHSYIYFLNDSHNPLMESIIRELDHGKSSTKNYRWMDLNDY